MEPELELAREFNLSEAQAKAYLLDVQGRFPCRPSARGILIFIRGERLARLPTPDDMVRLMTRSGGLTEPLVHKVLSPQPSAPDVFTPKRAALRAFTPKPAADIPARQRRAGFSKTGLIYESNLDYERLPPEEQECCPHGVPKHGPCAICNPKEFRSLTGID